MCRSNHQSLQGNQSLLTASDNESLFWSENAGGWFLGEDQENKEDKDRGRLQESGQQEIAIDWSISGSRSLIGINQ